MSTIVLGATGAVGRQVVRTCILMRDVSRLTLLGRRRLEGVSGDDISQAEIDVFDPGSYEGHLPGHGAAICTLGVGQPSKVSREELVRVDKTAVLAFARSCRKAGVRHFQLLGAVGADPGSRSFYLRTKGELEEGLKELAFERLSLFRPSVIVTPENRYGFTQALTLAIWPMLNPVLRGRLTRFRGVRVEDLGSAIALNLRGGGSGVEVLHWKEIQTLARRVR